MEKYKKVKSHTGWNDSGKGRNKYLSRHDIRCPKHAFLGGFRLKLQEKKNLKNNPSVRFNYSCVLPSFKVNLNVQKKKKSKKRRKPINPMKHYQKKKGNIKEDHLDHQFLIKIAELLLIKSDQVIQDIKLNHLKMIEKPPLLHIHLKLHLQKIKI